eukprot:CAMPEP_0179102662 /NCGR_PEP_ID=MMETSP0796-20121207/47527_1 /TAXON_ID=73915 /ORGANISM="Pyrodinium bahamense, Strain pbaha01" /LENGTH=483 /DNA_ID=CAMNT_0020800543 /DNA_START=59 /DNA_END=1512 /DNA_ORIENTATION=+
MPAGRDAAGEVADLRSEVSQLKQELRMHRQVLEECLQVREGCADLLAHREALTHCFELREGAQQPGQAAIGSERLNRIEVHVMESQEHLRELDLSLAGVSDNTAKQGKAISTLMEQQKCTSATLDAVVRAVKRLDRSRSRPHALAIQSAQGGPASTGCASGNTNGAEMEQRLPASASSVPTHGSGRDFAPGEATGSECDSAKGHHAMEWEQQYNQCPGAAEEQQDEETMASVPQQGDCRQWADQEFPETAESRRYGSTGSGGAWNWPGRGGEPEDQEEFRYASAGSSNGSDGRLWHRPSARPRAASAGRHRSGRAGQYGYSQTMGSGIPDPSMRGPCDLGADYGPGVGGQSAPSGASAEMANCVKGVLARIEEALTKLDGLPQQDAASTSSAGGATLVAGEFGAMGVAAPGALAACRTLPSTLRIDTTRWKSSDGGDASRLRGGSTMAAGARHQQWPATRTRDLASCGHLGLKRVCIPSQDLN